MRLFESALYTLRRYADFSGRASRSEFWNFFFFVILAQAAARILDTLLFARIGPAGPVAGLVGLLLIVPQIAVAVRRLHDVDRSGKELIMPGVMLLLAPVVASFTSLLGRIVSLGFVGLLLLTFAALLMLLLKEGRRIPNRYGASPKAFSFAR